CPLESSPPRRTQQRTHWTLSASNQHCRESERLRFDCGGVQSWRRRHGGHCGRADANSRSAAARATRGKPRRDCALRSRTHSQRLAQIFLGPCPASACRCAANPGWFELVTDKPGPLEPVPIVVIGNPADKPWEPPPEAEGEGAENAPRGILELPRLGGSPSASGPSTAPKPPVPIDAQPSLPFPDGLPPQLAPYVPGEKTSGILYTPGGSPIPLQSGYAGPAAAMQGTAGYDRYTLSHVEGHAAALMR